MTARARRGALAVATLALAGTLAGTLAGCGWFGPKAVEGNCPRVGILREAETLTRFATGSAARDASALLYEVAIADVGVVCRQRDTQLWMNVAVIARVSRGSVATRRDVQFNVVLAHTDGPERVLLRRAFPVAFAFEATEARRELTERIEYEIALPPKTQAMMHTVYVALQLTEEELRYNRERLGQ